MTSPFTDKVERYGKHWQTPWLIFGALLAFAIVACFLLRFTDRRRTPGVAQIEDGDLFKVIAAVRRAPRAMVFLDAKWSTNTTEGRRYFEEAISELSKTNIPQIEFFIVDEWPEDDKLDQRQYTQAWLASLDFKELMVGRGYGIGAGNILWLESNKVVAEEWSARSAKTSGIVRRTKSVWQR